MNNSVLGMHEREREKRERERERERERKLLTSSRVANPFCFSSISINLTLRGA